MKKFFSFFVSKKYLLNILAIAIVWLIIIFGTSFYLDSYTNFGEKIKVPSLYKIHVDDLDDLFKSNNITYVIVDSVYLDNWPKGTVCWQHPKPTDTTGQYVKSGREIQVSIVPLKPKLIKVPDVKDKSKRMGETLLKSIGFRTTVSYQPSNDGDGFILDQKINGQSINESTKAIKGTVIELIVARGNTGASTTLPNLVGLTIKQAKQRLLNLNLSIHPECISCETADDENVAVILKQSPQGGDSTKVPAGTTVTVWAEK
ncbi:MAG TPA: PASTA domain-containing protein [Crocinitomix sp.]|nr:PASTA domain-containing protein [Crocinitomix sp.]